MQTAIIGTGEMHTARSELGAAPPAAAVVRSSRTSLGRPSLPNGTVPSLPNEEAFTTELTREVKRRSLCRNTHPASMGKQEAEAEAAAAASAAASGFPPSSS